MFIAFGVSLGSLWGPLGDTLGSRWWFLGLLGQLFSVIEGPIDYRRKPEGNKYRFGDRIQLYLLYIVVFFVVGNEGML